MTGRKCNSAPIMYDVATPGVCSLIYIYLKVCYKVLAGVIKQLLLFVVIDCADSRKHSRVIKCFKHLLYSHLGKYNVYSTFKVSVIYTKVVTRIQTTDKE